MGNIHDKLEEFERFMDEQHEVEEFVEVGSFEAVGTNEALDELPELLREFVEKCKEVGINIEIKGVRI